MADRNLMNITITMTKEERRALKQAALDYDISVSALIRMWLKDYLEGQEEKTDKRIDK